MVLMMSSTCIHRSIANACQSQGRERYHRNKQRVDRRTFLAAALLTAKPGCTSRRDAAVPQITSSSTVLSFVLIVTEGVSMHITTRFSFRQVQAFDDRRASLTRSFTLVRKYVPPGPLTYATFPCRGVFRQFLSFLRVVPPPSCPPSVRPPTCAPLAPPMDPSTTKAAAMRNISHVSAKLVYCGTEPSWCCSDHAKQQHTMNKCAKGREQIPRGSRRAQRLHVKEASLQLWWRERCKIERGSNPKSHQRKRREGGG